MAAKSEPTIQWLATKATPRPRAGPFDSSEASAKSGGVAPPTPAPATTRQQAIAATLPERAAPTPPTKAKSIARQIERARPFASPKRPPPTPPTSMPA